MPRTYLLYTVLYLCCICQASVEVLKRASDDGASFNGPIVSLKAAAPANAMPLVSTHLSFSIEQDRWPEWTGIDARNEFTHNALVNLQHFTGQPPKIRVGANSEDHTVWLPTVTVVEAIFPPPSAVTPYPEATQITVGDEYYALSKWLPAGTHMTWGVNFGLDNATNAVNMAKSIMKAFSSRAVKAANVHLDLIEVGNEADHYKNHGVRPANWTVADYTKDWINITGAIVDAIGLDSHSIVAIQGAAFGGQDFTPTEILDLGILDSVPGKLISQISQHHYSAAFCAGGEFALASFMNKAAVRSNLTLFSGDMDAVRSKGLPYVLGETGSISCHGAPGVSNTAGAVLWVIDYTLQAATLGVVETYFHEGIGFKYNFIQPVSLNRSTTDGTPFATPQPPGIQPSYYAALLVARAVGSTGAARIVELAVSADNVSGYAIYEHNRLVRAVFVNLDAWLAGATGARPSVHLALDYDVSGVTFGGQSYETADALVSGKERLETIRVGDGVDLAATEAVLLTFQ